MSDKTLVKARAPWTLSEALPVIIMLGLGVFAITGFVLNWIVIGLAVFLGLIGFGVGLYLVYVNLNRKKKSTLNAEWDDKGEVRVWMNKPNKTKWNGKLDIDGKNIFNVNKDHKVTLEDIQGSDTLVLSPEKGKQYYVPVRFLRDSEEFTNFLVTAAETHKWSYTNEAAYALENYFPTSLLKEAPRLKSAVKKKINYDAPEEDLKKKATVETATPIAPLVIEPEVPVRTLSYAKFVPEPVAAVEDQVDVALERAEVASRPTDSTDLGYSSNDDLLFLGSTGKNSIVIELPADK